MLLNGLSLDCEANMAFISILPVGSHLIKQSVHECHFTDTDSHVVKDFNSPSLQLNSEE